MDLSRWMAVCCGQFTLLWMADNGTSRWAYHAVSRKQHFRSKIWSMEIQKNIYRIMHVLQFSAPSFQQLCRKTSERITHGHTHAHTHTHDLCMPQGLRPPGRHNEYSMKIIPCRNCKPLSSPLSKISLSTQWMPSHLPGLSQMILFTTAVQIPQ